MTIKAAAILGCVLAGLLGVGQILAGEPTRPYPTRVTVQTRADPGPMKTLEDCAILGLIDLAGCVAL
jgi:hypothetical protein